MSVAFGRPDLVAERRFFAGMAVAVLVVVFIGFANTYYLWPLTRATHTATGQPLPATTPLFVHVHAVLFSGWIALFVAQAGLAATGRTALHRRLGMASVGMLPLMVVVGVTMAIHGGRSGWNPGGAYLDSLSFMVAGFRDLTNFTVLTSAGLLYRRQPDIHRRLMLLGTVGGMLWPAIARIPFITGRIGPMLALLAVLVLAPAVYDFLTRARTRWLSLGIGLCLLATFPGAVIVGNSSWWRAFAVWVTQ